MNNDRAKCSGGHCVNKKNCDRYTCKEGDFQWWTGYIPESNDLKTFKCQGFIPNKNEQKNKEC